jgi:general secretion pathway protein G
MAKRKYIGGFTLIELLVVISIIGILMAILTMNFDEARKNSRDKARKSDLKALQLAIETYKSQNGSYPANCESATSTKWAGPGPQPGSFASCDDYIAGLVPDYIAALPTDPNQEQTNGVGYLYKTNIDHSAYKVILYQSVESEVVTAQSDDFSRYPEMCGTGGGKLLPKQYAVYSSGAACW